METTRISAQLKALKHLESQKKLTGLKNGVDTDKAFEALLEDKELWEKTGESIDTLYYVRNLYRNRKKNLTLDRKFELLRKAGFIESTVWTFNK